MKAKYSYLSDGTKASVLNASGAGYDYNGTFTYSHASGGTRTLESVAFGGGRIRKNGSTYAVDYYVTDHLGSVRAIVNASGTIVEQNDFYPFGTRQQNGLTTLSANRWRFSGKEGYDSAFGIALDDFGARRYDRTAWTSIDPLAEKYYSISPYAYCAGNPVRLVDPEGERIFVQSIQDNMITGFEWKELNGVWGFYDNQDNLYNGSDDFIINVMLAINSLMEGNHGNDLVCSIVKNSAEVYIQLSTINDNSYYRGSKSVVWTAGSNIQSAVSLAHELAHAQNDIYGTTNDETWIPLRLYNNSKPIKMAEIYSTHIENLIRKEHNMPLRTHYLTDENGIYCGPRIVDSRGRSIYYYKSGETSYSYVKPKQRYQY